MILATCSYFCATATALMLQVTISDAKWMVHKFKHFCAVCAWHMAFRLMSSSDGQTKVQENAPVTFLLTKNSSNATTIGNAVSKPTLAIHSRYLAKTFSSTLIVQLATVWCQCENDVNWILHQVPKEEKSIQLWWDLAQKSKKKEVLSTASVAADADLAHSRQRRCLEHHPSLMQLCRRSTVGPWSGVAEPGSIFLSHKHRKWRRF